MIYPSGWDNSELEKICGKDSGRYRTGDCNIRWAYILAILGIFDAAILAVLAFFLASKRAKIEMYSATGAVTKCKYNILGLLRNLIQQIDTTKGNHSNLEGFVFFFSL